MLIPMDKPCFSCNLLEGNVEELKEKIKVLEKENYELAFEVRVFRDLTDFYSWGSEKCEEFYLKQIRFAEEKVKSSSFLEFDKVGPILNELHERLRVTRRFIKESRYVKAVDNIKKAYEEIYNIQEG